MADNKTLVDLAVECLATENPFLKAQKTFETARLWKEGKISVTHRQEGDPFGNPAPPERPGWDEELVTLVPPNKAPRLGKGGSLASRQAIIHSLVHIERSAIDLSWDIMARFGPSMDMPRGFYSDFVRVAEEEAKHFKLLNERLEAMGSSYGALPAHDGLWESALETAGSLGARLAIEHCTHEARGLDILPQTVSRLRNGGDTESADLLWEVVYPDEISHCAVGVRWFTWLHERGALFPASGLESDGVNAAAAGLEALSVGGSETGGLSVHKAFHRMVRSHFHGLLKPPFNHEARAKAGFGEEWYLPLSFEEGAEA